MALLDLDYPVMLSLVMSTYQFYLKQGISSKEAYGKALEDVASAAEVELSIFRAWFNNGFSQRALAGQKDKPRRRRTRRKPVYITGVIAGKGAESFTIPKLNISLVDPFAEDEFVTELAKVFQALQPGCVGYQTYPSEEYATAARAMLKKVAGNLGWSKYQSRIEKGLLWVKRIE